MQPLSLSKSFHHPKGKPAPLKASSPLLPWPPGTDPSAPGRPPAPGPGASGVVQCSPSPVWLCLAGSPGLVAVAAGLRAPLRRSGGARCGCSTSQRLLVCCGPCDHREQGCCEHGFTRVCLSPCLRLEMYLGVELLGHVLMLDLTFCGPIVFCG